MKPTKDAKIGAVRKMQKMMPKAAGPMTAPMGMLREGHTKVSGSLLGELQGGAGVPALDMQESNNEMKNVFGQNKKQPKVAQDNTKFKMRK